MDHTGKKINNVLFVEKLNIKKDNRFLYKCICDCGKEFIIRFSNSIISCGCKKGHDLSGTIKNNISCVKKIDKRDKWGAVLYECVCHCGNSFISTFKNVKSCGCLNKVQNYINKNFNGMIIMSKTDKKTSTGNYLFNIKCHCGKIFQCVPSEVIRKNRKSCGCSQHLSGENNPRYNSSISIEDRKDRRQKCRAFRKVLLKQHNYTCEICGDCKKDNKNIHHLDGWHWNKNSRIDPKNISVLCKTCHRDFHIKYGYGNNTKEQFEEYRKIKCHQ